LSKKGEAMIDITAAVDKKTEAYSESYAPALRAIGQALEALQVRSFDMEARNEAYLVWDKTNHEPAIGPADVAGEAHQEPDSHWLESAVLRKEDSQNTENIQPLRYTAGDVSRLDEMGRAKRSSPNATPDAYHLSQLLRAVGGYVNHVGGHFLGLSWREQWVGVVYEKGGHRELEVFRPALLYDFWVRMYLMRSAATH
jgi:hypothetical protein